MNKSIAYRWSMVRLLIVLAVIMVCPAEGQSQTGVIDEVLFEPSAPRPGGELKVYLTLFPTADEQKTVAIRLRTYTDSNKDYKYQSHEIIKHRAIRVRDNEPGRDEEDVADEMLVHIYDVPLHDPPEKYAVQVRCGNDAKSASLSVPPAPQPASAPSAPPSGAFSAWNPLKISRNAAFEVVKNLSLVTRVVRDTQKQKPHHLYVYTPESKQVERISRAKGDMTYFSPSWSPDSAKIVCGVKQGEKTHLVWFRLADNVPHVIAGQAALDPFWLPDNRRVVFLRERRLWALDTDSEAMRVIAENLRVDQILGILPGEEERIQILYQAANTVYLLELNRQIQPLRDGLNELVDTPAWYLARFVSPSGEQVVYSTKVDSFITLVLQDTTRNQQERLFNDTYNYFEPCWSPDGSRLVFVSDRP